MTTSKLSYPPDVPSRWQNVLFLLKTKVFQSKRYLQEIGIRPKKHYQARELEHANVLAEVRHSIWTEVSAAEFSLTSGKVENLRVVARALHGLEISAGETFSFWRQVGRTTKSKGYIKGRELREGCIVPNIGGGLCQITGLLYQAALKAKLEVVERHQHSRLISGSMGERNLDATVFWNYVDLRFKADFDWRLEVELTASELLVKVKARHINLLEKSLIPQDFVERKSPSGDCLTCDQIECFRHPKATSEHSTSQSFSTFVLDSMWPEFNRWCSDHAREGDRWMLPIDGERWKKPNYQWSSPSNADIQYATIPTLLRSLRQRYLPAQGEVRQTALIEADRKLARFYAKNISVESRHLVVSQNLLPHLWELGVLGGRTFDVLVERWPMSELVSKLDDAFSKNSNSSTLADFRPDERLVQLEKIALKRAGRLITPHRDIAKLFEHRAWLVDWEFPEVEATSHGIGVKSKSGILFPASALGRKGIYELTQAIEGLDEELVVLGKASDDAITDHLDKLKWRYGSIHDLQSVKCVVLPAWVEHQPRVLLRALAMGVPVIASSSCGLDENPLLIQTKVGEVKELKLALLKQVGLA